MLRIKTMATTLVGVVFTADIQQLDQSAAGPSTFFLTDSLVTTDLQCSDHPKI
jgi:hypothetical protein